MILVTGAGGKTGQAVIAALAKQGVAIRAFVHRERSIPGATEIVVGDMSCPADWECAFHDITKVYHICPNMHPDEIEIGQMALAAAKKAKITHFVYHSVLHPQTEKMPHHWHKLRVEEMIFESDLPFTVLQPTVYMQNLYAQWQTILETGNLVLPYPISSQICLVDLADAASVAAKVLLEDVHHGATYELVGTKPLTQAAVAATFGQIIGRAVTANEVPLGQWQQQAQAAGLPNYAIETLIKMFDYYARYGLIGNSTVLALLLGHKPTTLTQCIEGWLDKS